MKCPSKLKVHFIKIKSTLNFDEMSFEIRSLQCDLARAKRRTFNWNNFYMGNKNWRENKPENFTIGYVDFRIETLFHYSEFS